MSQAIKLNAELRAITGKKVRQLRAQDVIPAVIYGQQMKNAVHIQLEGDALRQTLRQAGGTNLIEVTAGGNTYNVLVSEVQRDVLNGQILHVDFHSVALDVRIRAEVQVVTVGKSPLQAMSDVFIVTPATQVEIEALPTNLPHELQVDISRLENIGDVLTAADLQMPEGVTLISDADLILVATEYMRQAEEEEVPAEAAGEGAAEPEVIRKAKEEVED